MNKTCNKIQDIYESQNKKDDDDYILNEKVSNFISNKLKLLYEKNSPEILQIGMYVYRQSIRKVL